MRIVHINTADNEGGAARAAFRLHTGLLEAGHASSMLVGRAVERRPEIADVRPAPLAARAARRAIGEVERLTGLQYLLGWWGERIASHPLVRNADVIHLHNLHGGFFPLRALPALSRVAPLVWSVCDFWMMTGHCSYPSFVGCDKWRTGCGACPDLSDYPPIAMDTTALLWRTKRSLYARCEGTVVAKSRWALEMLKDSPLLAAFQKEYVPNGYRTEVFRPFDKAAARQALGLPPEARTVFVGAPDISSRRKGADQLGQVLAAAGRRVAGLTMIAVGQDSRSTIEDHAGYRVFRAGYLRNDALLAACYNAADVTLLPALADNSPNVMYESLACGVPVVAYRVGGIPDAVLHMETGLLAEKGDAGGLSDALVQIMEDDALRARLGGGGRALMLRAFSLDLQVQRFSSLYARLIAARSVAVSGIAACPAGKVP
jgi:glycosyltransferase involved in cell wall biosynthesis